MFVYACRNACIIVSFLTLHSIEIRLVLRYVSCIWVVWRGLEQSLSFLPLAQSLGTIYYVHPLGAISLFPPLRVISLIPPISAISLVTTLGATSLVPPLANIPFSPCTISLVLRTLGTIPLVPHNLGVIPLVPRLVAESRRFLFFGWLV